MFDVSFVFMLLGFFRIIRLVHRDHLLLHVTKIAQLK